MTPTILALLGFGMVIAFMMLIMTRRMSALAALILIPIIVALLAGFGPGIAVMAIKGVVTLAPTAAVLLFGSVTVDLFFDGPQTFAKWKDRPGLSVQSLSKVFGVEASGAKRIEAPEVAVIKFSYPRAHPQGGVTERDMHSGQQYVLLLEHEV